MARKRTKYRGLFPFHGTKLRQMALLLMRPQGLTAGEAFDLQLIKDKQAFNGILTRLEDNWPFIIQPIGEKPTGYRPQKIYRITSIIDKRGKFRNI